MKIKYLRILLIVMVFLLTGCGDATLLDTNSGDTTASEQNNVKSDTGNSQSRFVGEWEGRFRDDSEDYFYWIWLNQDGSAKVWTLRYFQDNKYPVVYVEKEGKYYATDDSIVFRYDNGKVMWIYWSYEEPYRIKLNADGFTIYVDEDIELKLIRVEGQYPTFLDGYNNKY
jgi:hypothetical protein